MNTKKKTLIRMIVIMFVFAFVHGLFNKLFKVDNYLISGSIYYIFLLGFIIYTIKKAEHRTIESIGFDLHNIFKKIILGVVIFVILEIIFTIVYKIILGIDAYYVHLPLLNTVVYTVYFIFLLGFTEELIFRGYLLERFKELFNSNIHAILLSSLIFALWHYPTNYSIGQVIFAFFFGIILSLIKVKSKGNIIVSLAIGHGLYNSFVYLAGYFIK